MVGLFKIQGIPQKSLQAVNAKKYHRIKPLEILKASRNA